MAATEQNIEPGVRYIFGANKSSLYVTFQESSTLHFIGCIRMKVLFGSVKINGSIIQPDGKFHSIFSTSTHPTYMSHAASTCPYMEISSLEEFLFSARVNPSFDLSIKDAETILCKLSEVDMENHVSLCRVKSSPMPLAYFARKKFNGIFHTSDTKPILPFFYPLKVAKSLLTPNIAQYWESVIDQISQISSPTLVVCGPKGVGKSSFSVYAANYLLNRYDCVLFVECDPGQPEFIAPGSLGVQALTKPKIGPAYTHKVFSDINYFFGSTTPSSNPELYIEIVKKLWGHVLSLDYDENNIVIVVNTCGWVEGLGISLLSDLVYLMKPSFIVAHYVTNREEWLANLTPGSINRNRVFTKTTEYPASYDIDIVSTASLFPPNVLFCRNKCLLFRVESFLSTVVPTVKTPQFSATDLRTLSLIYFLSKRLKVKSNYESIEDILFQCPLYQVPISHCFYQKVSIEFPNSGLIDVINANVVGLGIANSDSAVYEDCTVLEENIKFLNPADIYNCVGLAFVRFIDEKNKLLFITTPIKMNKLAQVNVIMIGTNSLCQSLLHLRDLKDNSLYSMKIRTSHNRANKFRKPNKQLKTRKTLTRHIHRLK